MKKKITGTIRVKTFGLFDEELDKMLPEGGKEIYVGGTDYFNAKGSMSIPNRLLGIKDKITKWAIEGYCLVMKK